MKARYLFSFVLAALLAVPAFAVSVQEQNIEAMTLQKGSFWNLKATKNSSTVYGLKTASGGTLSPSDYGVVNIAGVGYKVTKPMTLTQGACSTLWGSSGTHETHLYLANLAATAGTSVSDSSPSTDISAVSDTNFKIAVDGNPTVAVTLANSGKDTGAKIATEMQTKINSALLAAGYGARVTVAYTTVYTITSTKAGERSKVVVTAGASASIADELKIGVAASGVETAGSGSGLDLCVSDKPNLTTVGSAALGATGYVKCNRRTTSTDALRMVGHASLNCTGPVIAADPTASVYDGANLLPVSFYGQSSSTTTGSATVSYPVQGAASGNKCVVVPVALGTGPSYPKTVASGANKIDVVYDAAFTAGTSTINYLCW